MPPPIPQPTILHPITLESFISHLLAVHAPPSLLIICSSQATFISQLLVSTSSTASTTTASPLAPPTLATLAASATLKVAFCPTLPHLQAFLAAHGLPEAVAEVNAPGEADAEVPPRASDPRRTPLLALLSPLTLHRSTPSFSAQGLTRTLSSCVEASARSGQALLIGECPSPNPSPDDEEWEALRAAMQTDEGEMLLDEVKMEDEEDERDGWLGPVREEGRLAPGDDIWAESVGILNASTKSWGVGREGWVGRTVEVRKVFGRYCVFRTLEEAGADTR
ncbi:hypothetical protein EJ06DRAFT_559811 [Trichodelitschia bisporula]|uniref:Uncharacterized protein n=1 Tax=Trichodelitschia bisporula TaxID=703511 RepID=A0A6G1HLI7_9PEZI|nr:hypothetical protein EJ06DRAFT_559811 [Trichodelitschia bisporula]